MLALIRARRVLGAMEPFKLKEPGTWKGLNLRPPVKLTIVWAMARRFARTSHLPRTPQTALPPCSSSC